MLFRALIVSLRYLWLAVGRFLQVARQLAGNFSYFEQLFFVSSNFLNSEQFL